MFSLFTFLCKDIYYFFNCIDYSHKICKICHLDCVLLSRMSNLMRFCNNILIWGLPSGKKFGEEILWGNGFFWGVA